MAEVMVAMLILALGAMAVLNLISAEAHSSYRNEQTQVVSDRLQQEMERITALPYAKIALTGLPAASADPSNPAARVQGVNFAVNRDGTGAAPLVYDGSALYGGGSICDSTHECGAVDPTPTHFSSGNVGGTIYRYVVWQNDPTCSDTACPGSQDLKRVIVAVALDPTAAGGTRIYQEIQTQVSDPNAQPASNSNPAPGSNGSGYPWTFWLTDTTCNNATRQTITGDHLTHNTRGVCSAGLQNGNNPGAPDLMVNSPPTLTTETPLYDYATDVEPPTGGDQDKGLQLMKGSGTGCDSQALTVASGPETDQPTRFQQLHEWLSPPIPSGATVALIGSGTLNLWSETVGGASYNGEICIWLFVRTTNGSGSVVQTAAVNQSPSGQTYFTYTGSPWPAGWSEIHVPLSFTLGTQLGAGAQLGLAVGVHPTGTAGSGLQFLYDEPSFDSRLEVNSTTSPPSL
jgi:hypothetical protein